MPLMGTANLSLTIDGTVSDLNGLRHFPNTEHREPLEKGKYIANLASYNMCDTSISIWYAPNSYSHLGALQSSR